MNIFEEMLVIVLWRILIRENIIVTLTATVTAAIQRNRPEQMDYIIHIKHVIAAEIEEEEQQHWRNIVVTTNDGNYSVR